MSLTFKGSVRPGKNKCTFSLLTLVLSAMLIVQLSFIQILFQSVRSLPPQPTQRTQVVFCLWPSQHWRSCLKKNCSNWYSEAVSLTLGKPQTILRTPLITIAFYWRNNPFLRSQRGLWIIWSDANTVSVRCFRCSFRQGPFTSITLAVEAGISETDLSKVGQTKAKLSCSVRLRENVFFFLSCGCTDPF